MKSIVFDDRSITIKIDSQVLAHIYQYRQTEVLQKEAGGVLIGRELESTGNLIIEKVTEPKNNDKRSRCRFERRDQEHLEFFQKLYLDSRETYGYFGEWHTHPERIPHYSEIDRRHWNEIFRELPEQHLLLFLIVGIDEIGIWKLDLNAFEQPIKVNETEWISLV